MSTHIERVVTDVSVEPETPDAGDKALDRRWVERRRVEAAIKARVREERRLAAEGFDD